MKKALVFLWFFGPWAVVAQSSYAPMNETYYHWIDRYEIKTGHTLPHLFTSVKPYKRSGIVSFLDSANQLGVFSSTTDRFNLEYFNNDNWEWSRPETNQSRKPFLKSLYKKKSDLVYVDIPEIDLHVNPVLYLGVGNDSRLDDMTFINTRGLEVRGMLDGKVGFYTYLSENQTQVPLFISETIREDSTRGYYPVIPHEGFWKSFKEDQGYDFFQARGYISFEATKHINLQLGHDRFFIGNGYRSLIFSDFSTPGWFFKGNVKVWKLNYMFLLNQFTADVKGNSGGLTSVQGGYPNKFVSMHHLSINIGKKWNIGVFESVVSSPDETENGSFRLDYLNPIIFYRAIEQQNGSSDNVLLGLDFKWNAFKGIQFYGQFVLDEFLLDFVTDGNGWWANKFGVQFGGKYIDAFGLPNLDLQAEANVVRPYTYSHSTKYGSYSNYNQAIAHPLGANFKELIGIVRYQPIPRLNLVGKLIYIKTGRDTTSYNFGGDILKDNSYRNTYSSDSNFGNTIAQGVSNTISYASFIASFQVKHNLFIDATLVLRRSESEAATFNSNSTITSLA
ncbi:MAG: hypothetical protein OEU76_04320, partial [Cyclobacteriaceae bacterium]|nr:hypothetical protein [Cyclobacteriaceae bacterium]